jgi:hypothetical protein
MIKTILFLIFKKIKSGFDRVTKFLVDLLNKLNLIKLIFI